MNGEPELMLEMLSSSHPSVTFLDDRPQKINCSRDAGPARCSAQIHGSRRKTRGPSQDGCRTDLGNARRDRPGRSRTGKHETGVVNRLTPGITCLDSRARHDPGCRRATFARHDKSSESCRTSRSPRQSRRPHCRRCRIACPVQSRAKRPETHWGNCSGEVSR